MVTLRVGTVVQAGRFRVLLTDDRVTVFLDEVLPDAPGNVRELVATWGVWEGRVRAAVGQAVSSVDAEAAGMRWAPPLVPGKILCVGSNFHDHVAEMAGPANIAITPSPFPFSFLKPTTALVGSGETVAFPAYGHKLDWEAELAVVIGDPAAATGPDPLRAAFGYTILNDLSLRDFIPFPHALGLDAVVSKGFDGAAPVGPWITLADGVPDPQSLTISLTINGVSMQHGTTAKMIFSVAELIAHYGRVMTLEPGDLIATGTPAGVGAARTPPRYLVPGDRVDVGIDDLASLHTFIGPAIAQYSLVRSEVG